MAGGKKKDKQTGKTKRPQAASNATI